MHRTWLCSTDRAHERSGAGTHRNAFTRAADAHGSGAIAGSMVNHSLDDWCERARRCPRPEVAGPDTRKATLDRRQARSGGRLKLMFGGGGALGPERHG
jgi:hypothetical protein